MTGLYFDDLEEGLTIRHEIGRTVTETDNVLFTSLAMNPQPLHLNAEFAAQTEHGRIIVNSFFTMALVTGLTVADITLGTTLGNLGYSKIELPRPVFIGDTLRVETFIAGLRASKSRPNAGIVTMENRGFNQKGELVCLLERTDLMLRRPSAG